MVDLPPFPSNGVNVHCLTLANICEKKGIPQSEAVSLILSHNAGLRPGRTLSIAEVTRAVGKAYNVPLPDDPNWSPAPKPKKPTWEPSTSAKAILRERIELCDLWESSPIRCDTGMDQINYLEGLFPRPGGLLCIGRSAFDFDTRPLGEFSELGSAQFIVSSYMTNRRGLTQCGKESAHALANTGERIYCVCDFDEPASDDHPSIIWELKKLGRLVMVLSSGGKSLHAWFSVPSPRRPGFWRAAIRLGADPALMRNKSSFVRIPEGTRDNGNKQRVYYFNPITEVGAQ